MTYMQGALDTATSGFSTLLRGLSDLAASLWDILRDTPLILVLSIFVVVLLGLNMWTYFTYSRSGRSDARRARRIGQRVLGMETDEVGEAMRLLLESAGERGGAGAMRALLAPGEEARELMRLIEDVEMRAARLRAVVLGAIEDGRRSINDLD